VAPRVFKLGKAGLNLTGSPLHLADDELLRAENVAIVGDQLEDGIRKRDGLAKLVADALAGPVFSLINCPIAEPVVVVPTVFAGPYFLHDDNLTGEFGTHPDGPISGLLRAHQEGAYALAPVVARYLGQAGTTPSLVYAEHSGGVAWDGTLSIYDVDTDATASRVTSAPILGANPALHGILATAQRAPLYVAWIDATDTYVFSINDGEGYDWTQVGDTIGTGLGCFGVSIAVFDGAIWLATTKAGAPNKVQIYSATPPGGWVLDTEFDLGGAASSSPMIAASDTYLWLTSPDDVAGTVVRKRTVGGVWSEVSVDAAAEQIWLLGATGSAAYWLTVVPFGDTTVMGTDDGTTVTGIHTYGSIYQLGPGIEDDDSICFPMVEDRNIGPWLVQRCRGVTLTTVFTVEDGGLDGAANDYVDFGGVG
jgi:hypothetical protein